MNSAKRKIYITLGLCGIVSVGFIILVILPLVNDIKEQSELFVSQREDLAVLRGKIEDIRQFLKVSEVNQDNLDKIDALFINPQVPTDIIKFVGFLREAAEDLGENIIISGPAIRGKVKTDFWPSADFSVSNLTGYSQDLSECLGKLEAAPFLVEIQQLNIARSKSRLPGESADAARKVSADFLIKVYTK